MPSRPSYVCSVLTAIGSSAGPNTLIVIHFKSKSAKLARNSIAKTIILFVHIMLTGTLTGWRLMRRIGRSRRRIIQIQRKFSREASKDCRESCLIAPKSLLVTFSSPTLMHCPRRSPLPDQMMDLMTQMLLPETK